jgi:hypothetical protein
LKPSVDKLINNLKMKNEYEIFYDEIPQRKPILNELPKNIDFEW